MKKKCIVSSQILMQKNLSTSRRVTLLTCSPRGEDPTVVMQFGNKFEAGGQSSRRAVSG